MPVELSIVESITELETTVVEVVLDSSSAPGVAGPGVPTGGTDGQVLTKTSATDYATAWEDPTGGPGGGVTDADYLVGTAHGDLSAEIVVGTTPGGELGGTWAAPTVDATHSGSTHAGIQAAAEATAAAALAAHEADTTSIHGIANTANLYSVGGTDVAIADGGTGASTAAGARANLDLEAGTDFPSLTTFNDHSARHENGGADEISLAGLDGTPTELTNHLSDATDAHDASAISVLDTGTFYTATDVEGVLAEIAPQLGGGSGEALQRDIAQTGHGLAVGNVVRYDGADYIKAQANSAANAEVVGIVAVVPDTDNFTLHYGGRVTGLSGLSAGSVYYLDDDTAGLLTTTEPPDAGDISKPLLIADSTTSGYFFNWRGALNIDMATQAELDAHTGDTSDAHDASAISFSPTGSVAATDVQAAIAEVASEASGIPTDGWIAAGETWTYASDDDPTFTFTIAGVDLTGKYQAGQRIKLTQTTAKYFIITKVAFSTDTTITIYGGTDYDLVNAAISSPFWSPVKAPFGFPLDPEKWTVEVTDTGARTQTNPVDGTWYNLNSNTISIPIGCWRVVYQATLDVSRSTSSTGVSGLMTLSTANNSQSDISMSCYGNTGDASATGKRFIQTYHRERTLTLAAKTSYFLNQGAAGSATSLDLRGDLAMTIIRAVCAYL